MNEIDEFLKRLEAYSRSMDRFGIIWFGVVFPLSLLLVFVFAL